MIDLSKYIEDVEDLNFLESIIEILSGQSDVMLKYGDFSFKLEAYGEKVEVWSFGEKMAAFDNVDSFLEGFLLDGKPFIECISEVDFD